MLGLRVWELAGLGFQAQSLASEVCQLRVQSLAVWA